MVRRAVSFTSAALLIVAAVSAAPAVASAEANSERVGPASAPAAIASIAASGGPTDAELEDLGVLAATMGITLDEAIRRFAGVNVVLGGDSGGPWYYGNTGWDITSGYHASAGYDFFTGAGQYNFSALGYAVLWA